MSRGASFSCSCKHTCVSGLLRVYESMCSGKGSDVCKGGVIVLVLGRGSGEVLTRWGSCGSSCALCNVCANHEANKRQAREVGALPVLVHLLSTSQVTARVL